MVRKLFAPHITKSAVKKPPSRLGIANKLISPPESVMSLESSGSFGFSVVKAQI